MRIILIGFMGSGKTALGKRLAKKLQYPFFDTDLLIEKHEGKSIQEIFNQLGETYFRKQEANLIRSFQFPEDCVIACGGGLPCHNENMKQLLRLGFVFYLKLSVDFLTKRLELNNESRPLLSGLETAKALQDYVAQTLSQRECQYSLANQTLALESIKPKQVINSMLESLKFAIH